MWNIFKYKKKKKIKTENKKIENKKIENKKINNYENENKYEYYINTYEKWENEEEEILIEEFNNGTELLDIIKKLKRFPLTVKNKLKNLELINNITEIKGYEKYEKSELYNEIRKFYMNKSSKKMKIIEKWKKLNGKSVIILNENKKEHKCKNQNCENYIAYCDLCLKCFEIEYGKRKLRCYIKETIVINEILKKFEDKNYKWYKNKCFESTKKRIDLQLELEDKIILIEIDEYKHSSYNKEEEEKRTTEIINNKQKKILLIRFNPDEYINEDGILTGSCWRGKNIKKNKINEWNERLKKLFETIFECINMNMEEIDYKIIYLFYNQPKK